MIAEPEGRGVQDWAVTHPGMVRQHNEDAMVRRPELGLWAVADGAGGHRTGDVASAMIATALGGIPASLAAGECLGHVRLRLGAVHDALRGACRARGRRGQRNCLDRRRAAGARWPFRLPVGRRLARLPAARRRTAQQITRDHSLVQALVDSGDLAPADAEHHPQANVITRAVGADEPVLELDKVTGRLIRGDRFLLCTDGLCKTLDDGAMAALDASDPDDPASRLIEAALAAGARDNVTAVVVQPATELADAA